MPIKCGPGPHPDRVRAGVEFRHATAMLQGVVLPETATIREGIVTWQ